MSPINVSLIYCRIWVYDVDWMFRLLWWRLFPLATVLSLLRLGFFFSPPAGPAVIFALYLVCPDSDLSVFLFWAEKESCNSCTTEKFVVLRVDCFRWLYSLKLIRVEAGVMCSRHPKGNGWPGVRLYLIPNDELFFFSTTPNTQL